MSSKQTQEHFLIPKEVTHHINYKVGRWCSCGYRLGESNLDDVEVAAALNSHIEAIVTKNEVETFIIKLRQQAQYYVIHDVPDSWYRSNPSDARIHIHYKDLLVLLDYIDELKRSLSDVLRMEKNDG